MVLASDHGVYASLRVFVGEQIAARWLKVTYSKEGIVTCGGALTTPFRPNLGPEGGYAVLKKFKYGPVCNSPRYHDKEGLLDVPPCHIPDLSETNVDTSL